MKIVSAELFFLMRARDQGREAGHRREKKTSRAVDDPESLGVVRVEVEGAERAIGG